MKKQSWLLVGFFLMANGSAYASLGEKGVNPVARAAHALSATPGVTASGVRFEHVDWPLADGGVVREYRDDLGYVFAVTWNAPTMPDLAALLGKYKGSLDGAQVKAQGKVRSPGAFVADDGEWSILSTGRLRAYKGLSYLKSKLPVGFDIKDIQP